MDFHVRVQLICDSKSIACMIHKSFPVRSLSTIWALRVILYQLRCVQIKTLRKHRYHVFMSCWLFSQFSLSGHQKVKTKLKQNVNVGVCGWWRCRGPGVVSGCATNVIFRDITQGILLGFELDLYPFIFVLCFECFSLRSLS